MDLNIGDKAPEFKLLSETNETVTLKELRGKKVILYFYPKDNTPGCTQEACDFRDAIKQFNQNNTVILGISKDSAETHKKFKDKYKLPFMLLADTEGKVCDDYGIFRKKSMFGRTFLGIVRSTFLIDEQGIIRDIWRKVKVNGHTEEVLKSIS